MKKERKIFILLEFLEYNSLAGKPFAICYAFLFVFLSLSFFCAQVGNGQNFSEIMISEGATIISEDSNLNTHIVNKEIHVLNGSHQFGANGVTIIISGDDTISHNDHINHRQKLSYIVKKIKIQGPGEKKTQECNKIKDFDCDQVSSTPFIPHNFFRSKCGFTECFIISIYNYKVYLASITSRLYYSKSLIEDLHYQKYNFENELLLFLKTESFFTRPPPDKLGLLSIFI